MFDGMGKKTEEEELVAKIDNTFAGETNKKKHKKKHLKIKNVKNSFNKYVTVPILIQSAPQRSLFQLNLKPTAH